MITNDKIKITLFHLSWSGSNNYYLYQAASDELREKYNIELLTMEQAKMNRYIDESDVYITTHGEYLSDYDKVNIDLWHGFPLKGMAKMDKQEISSDEQITHHWNKKDLIMSYSAVYNTAMNACNGANISQYRITGVPRNDALFSKNSHLNLNKVLPNLSSTEGDKIIFFMPTFRQSVMTPGKIEGDKDFTNFFGLPSLSLEHLEQFLEEKGLQLVIKLHPFEEIFFASQLRNLHSQRIHVLNDAALKQAELDLYDTLGAADMLITDYSSVYIDYLLLDRPILFIPTDLDAYRENRGFLFEPYELWTPGPKLFTQAELQKYITDFIVEPDLYGAERNLTRSMLHYYQDNNSSQRIWNLIDHFIQTNMDVILKRRKDYKAHKELQQQVKQRISSLIEQGHLNQANTAINQYLETNSADPDIFAMNGMLHLLIGSPLDAIDTFKKGHDHFPWDEDLIYNLGYAFESSGDLVVAREYYLKAQKMTSKLDLIDLLDERIKAISIKL